MILAGGMPTAGALSVLRPIRMRRALPSDRTFALSLVPRLVAASLVRWRNPRKACFAYAKAIEAILVSARSQSALLVGEREDSTPLGVVLLAAASNCYTHERQGHLAQVAVAGGHRAPADAIGLIDGAKAWARSHGYVVLMPEGFWIAHPVASLPGWVAPGAERRDATIDFSTEK